MARLDFSKNHPKCYRESGRVLFANGVERSALPPRFPQHLEVPSVARAWFSVAPGFSPAAFSCLDVAEMPQFYCWRHCNQRFWLDKIIYLREISAG